MDPLAHTLAGAALAETRLGRRGDSEAGRSALATATLLVAANLPDVDAVAYLHSEDLAFLVRRGWTHGVLALVLWPPLLAWLMWGIGRWWRGRHGGEAPSYRRLVLLSAVGVSSHPLLDWLNTYGVRLLMPFDDRWFYGDALFIVDPWLWLGLGAAVYAARAPHTMGGRLRWLALAAVAAWFAWPRAFAMGDTVGWAAITGWALVLGFGWWAEHRAARVEPGVQRSWGVRVATGAVALLVVYAAGMVGLRAWAEHRAAEGLAERGMPLAEEGYRPGDAYRLMVGPVPVTPFHRGVTARTVEGIWVGEMGLPSGELVDEGRLLPPLSADLSEEPLLIREALRSRSVRGMMVWQRFPWTDVETTTEGGERVWLMDARYARRRTADFGGLVVAESSP
jgi:inner membrane protein